MALITVSASQTRGIMTDSPGPASGLKSPTSNSSEPIAPICCRTPVTVVPGDSEGSRQFSADALMEGSAPYLKGNDRDNLGHGDLIRVDEAAVEGATGGSPE